MPLIKIIKQDTDTKIAIWEIVESSEELLDLLSLSQEEEKRYDSLPTKRQLEFLGVRCALKELGVSATLKKRLSGKPMLENSNYHISISHSKNIIAVGVSSLKIGIDLESEQGDKLTRIKHKFLHLSEIETLEITPNVNDYLQAVWGIKESLYKILDTPHISLSRNYYITEFTSIDKPIKCTAIEKGIEQNFIANIKKIDRYYLVIITK